MGLLERLGGKWDEILRHWWKDTGIDYGFRDGTQYAQNTIINRFIAL